MLFNSQLFILCFLPCALGLYYLAAPSRSLRQAVLVAASLAFYGYWNIRFVPLLVALTLANWLVVRAYGRWRQDALLVAGVVMNLAVLGVCKYANFAASSWDALWGGVHQNWGIVLPLGISFFTFQKISYLVDLRRGDRHVYGLLEFAAFVTFFPQLIAGPLVRHNEIIPQFALPPRRSEIWENLARGAVLFTIGLIKKAAIADTVAMICDPLYARAAVAPLTLAEAWAAAGSYTLQIFFDFSGYSDMAIGLGLMFGFRLPFNFAAPYRATSIRDFWRRWHITLSRFLRDYVYIPLGGNRSGAAMQAVNVVATMLLGGLWHGAAWTFVAWGGLHGLGLAINGAWHRAGWRMPALLGWALTLLFVIIGWVLFRSPDFATAASVLTSMAGVHGVGRVHVDNAPVVALAVLAALVLPPSQDLALKHLRASPWIAVPLGAALVFLLLLVGGRVPNEFIYFQF
jgi:alginate O-acetyltransferase complex protein AlgI